MKQPVTHFHAIGPTVPFGAWRLKMGMLIQFLVAALKVFHDDIAWSKKDLWAVDVLLSVMFMSFFLLVL